MLLSCVVAVLTVVLDFATKYLVKTLMQLGQTITVIPGFFNITYVLNKGAAWGILADKRWIFLSFSTVAIVLIAVLLYYFRKSELILRISLSLVLGGGVGNMIDRIFNGDILFDGAVVDFLQTSFIDFPVFNIADSAVCIGAALMFVYILFYETKNARTDKNGEANG